ncbi:hypothetical protein Y032_0018g3612 [Ancylostoma ceylanicum]|uniref:Uncharacterized protein n=1 Tax=Ancylostoma ceylanicum TaxID=53326 RepID=A0A016V4H9_9BILA|nr:hypothetical protein Y032_0018g3612 [Ancylostoma ceylanicum]
MDPSFWWTLVDVEFIISILTMIYYSWILFIMLSSTSTVFRSAFFRIFIVTEATRTEIRFQVPFHMRGEFYRNCEKKAKNDDSRSSSDIAVEIMGFFDIQAIVVAEWIRADQRLGFGPNYELVTRTMYGFTGSHFFTHIFGCFLMTLNRHMAVCHPNAYEKCIRSYF